MIRKAWGITMVTIVRAGDMPSERAASVCPRGTAWIPARIVSAMYGGRHEGQRQAGGAVLARHSDQSRAMGIAKPTAIRVTMAGHTAEELDVGGREPSVGLHRRQAHEREREPDREATDEGERRVDEGVLDTDRDDPREQVSGDLGLEERLLDAPPSRRRQITR